MTLRKGIILALITACISGVSIFLNSFAVKVVKDPFVLTGARNLLVVFFLSSLLIGMAKWVDLRKLSLKQWSQLILIGIVGGSIPFLLFFKGLSVSSAAAVNGAFIHKTLFIWVAILAVVFLKEKLNFWQIGALGVLIAGIYLLSGPALPGLGGPKNWQFGYGERLVFLAVIFWAIENIIAKIILKEMPAIIVSWGRMFFGSIVLIGFLSFTHRLGSIGSLNQTQWFWILGTSILLFGYVGFWYSALKYAPATVVTSILTLGFPLTVILQSIFVWHKFDWKIFSGLILVLFGVYLFGKMSIFRKKLVLKNA